MVACPEIVCSTAAEPAGVVMTGGTIGAAAGCCPLFLRARFFVVVFGRRHALRRRTGSRHRGFLFDRMAEEHKARDNERE